MAHNLDITNGATSLVLARESAWHQLGTVLEDSFTAEQAMREGHLGGWNVRKSPLYTMTEEGSIPIPGKYAVIRDNPVQANRIDALGVAGEVYTPIQNEAHAALLDALVDESGAHFETAGAIEGGRKVFITMRLPETMLIGGKDAVDQYIVALNSHDSSLPFTLMMSPVRVVCQNTMNYALQEAKNTVSYRHTRFAEAAVRDQARAAMDLSFKYLGAFQDEANRMIETTLTQVAFEELVAREFGAAEEAGKAAKTRAQTQIDEMVQLFADAGTQDGIRNTVWAGLNALTEWSDHMAPARGTDVDVARMTRAALYPEFKIKAHQLMLALV